MSAGRRTVRGILVRDRGWITRLKVGDVVRSGSGMLRVVRAVCHSKSAYATRSSVTFSIKACSWTHRCYTVLTCSDLLTLGYRPTRAKVSLRKKIDRAIQADFGVPRPRLSCCDVRDVA